MISGTPPLGTFPSIMAAYVIGHPQYPGDMAIYLLSQPVGCDQLAPSGWSFRMAAPTGVLELLLAGTTATSYPLSSNTPPTAPDGYGRDIYATSGGSRVTQNGDTGTVELTAIDPDGTAHGSFSVAFAVGSLTGSFTAASCPSGMPP
jgi:hypothetical protein